MSTTRRYSILWGLALALLIIIALPTAASLNAADARPMQTHDFTDVPFAGKEFMEPFINEFYHQGVTTGCNPAPLQYCPEANVTRGEMAVFVGRALGYVAVLSTGHKAEAYFNQTDTAGTSHALFAQTVNGDAVRAIASGNGTGVRGVSVDGEGMIGSSNTGVGVLASSSSDFAISATSNNQTAMFLTGANLITDVATDTLFDLQLGGGLGELFASTLNLSGNTVNVISNGNVVIDLDDDNNSGSTFSIRNGLNVTRFTVDEDGNMSAAGTKAAMVDTVHYGTRKLYAVESPENWFEDFGTGQLVNGMAVIEIDAMFTETVNLSEVYHVYLTPIGDGAVLYIDEQTPTSFTVRSTNRNANVQFHYRLVAKRLGYEDVRMEEVGGD